MSAAVPSEVEELLTEHRVEAYLATCSDGGPHVAPLWYRYEDGTVEVLTSGRKLDNVRANPRVSLAMGEHEAGMPSWTVTLQGTATIVEDDEEIEAANRQMNERYGTEDAGWPENVLVRIDVGTAAYRTWER